MMCVSFVDLLESVTSLQAAADELSTAVARVEDRVMNLNSTLIDVDGRVVDLMTLTEVESRVEENEAGIAELDARVGKMEVSGIRYFDSASWTGFIKNEMKLSPSYHLLYHYL